MCKLQIALPTLRLKIKSPFANKITKGLFNYSGKPVKQLLLILLLDHRYEFL
jgi:hypothetical protein